MNKHVITIVVIAIALALCGSGSAGELSDYASLIVSCQGPFGGHPYGDPNAVLGPPTAYVRDIGIVFPISMVYGAWNVTSEGIPAVLTLWPSSELVVGFDHKVGDDVNNPYGIDLIVFSNTFFQRQGSTGYLTPTTDMGTVILANPASINDEWVTVSVAQDPNGPWFTFPADRATAGDLFPTNPFAWDSTSGQWGGQMDFLKPVDPNLSLGDFNGLSVPQAIALYDGSAGGTGFDLKWLEPEDYKALKVDPFSGRKWIQYVKLTSLEYGEVDAVADVAACGDYKHPFPLGDINRDCRVDLADFAVLAENWTACTWKCGP